MLEFVRGLMRDTERGEERKLRKKHFPLENVKQIECLLDEKK